MSNDKNKDFNDLRKHESAGVDYRIRTRIGDAIVVIAPHAGGIEPGTSEIAEAIAGPDHSLYLFEGMKRADNGDLHVTSAHFDEPSCLALLANSEAVLAIHGEERTEEAVLIGGLDATRMARIGTVLKGAGFTVIPVDKPHLDGRAANNICNRGRGGAGVQLEITEGLRRTFFRQLSPRAERQYTTPAFQRFIAAVRDALT